MIVLILNIPVSAEISYIGKAFSLSVKYLFFTVFRYDPNAPKKPKDSSSHKGRKKKPTDESDEDKPRQKKKPGEILELIGTVKTLLESSGKGIRRIVRGIRLYDLEADIDVANEDAAEAAIGYGKMNILVYNLLAFFRTFFTVEIRHININCVYNSSASKQDISLKISLRPATVLVAAVSILSRFLLNTMKERISCRAPEAQKAQEAKTA